MQLPPECRKDGHYSVHAEIFKKCRVAPNALREGMPVLVKSCGSHFDEAPFSPAALEELARAQNQLVEEADDDGIQAPFVQMLLTTRQTSPIVNITMQAFFDPLKSLQNSACDPVSEPLQAGYIVADLGVQPEEQAQALYGGCDALGIGDLVRPDASRNVCSHLENEEKNPVCGTRLPDLGPKLYIARPRVQLDAGGRKEFEGETFTRLHCDLSDAVNYSYGPGDAIWTIFAAEDRKKLQAILAKKKKDLFFVSEAAFLTEADLEETELPYAQFVQKQGDLVLIPAGCPHQVVNCSPLPTVKVAQDFLAPESVSRCWEMMQEMREVKATDKLQLRLTLRFYAAYLDKVFENLPASKRVRLDKPVPTPSSNTASPTASQEDHKRAQGSEGAEFVQTVASEQLPNGLDMGQQETQDSPPQRSCHDEELAEGALTAQEGEMQAQQDDTRDMAAAESLQQLASPHQQAVSDQVTPAASSSLTLGRGMHDGFSDTLKQRSIGANLALKEAAGRLKSRWQTRIEARTALEEALAEMKRAQQAYVEAEDADFTAQDKYAETEKEFEAKEKAVSDIGEEVKVNLREAQKLLKLFA